MRVRKTDRVRIACTLLLSVLSLLTLQTPVPVHAEEEAASIPDYTIRSAEDWEEFARLAHSDIWSMGRRVILETDLTLTGQETPCILYFAGTLEGRGHTINGVTIRTGGSHSALFEELSQDGTIRDLKVIGAVLPEERGISVGGIVGINHGNIENCSFRGSVSAHDHIGGIAGINAEGGSIKKCVTEGIVEGDTTIGGIVGENAGMVSDCANAAQVNTVYTDVPFSTDEITITIDEILKTGRVTTPNNVMQKSDIGGIAGYNTGEILSCTNREKVGYEHVGFNIGGIAGRSIGRIRTSRNEGEILGRRNVGGIVGQQQPDLEISFTGGKLKEIDKALDTLGSTIDSTLSQTEGYTDDTSRRLLQISGLIDNAKGDVKTLTDDATYRADEAAARANAATSAMQSSLSDFSEASRRIADYADRVSGAGGRFSDALGAYLDKVQLSEEDRKEVDKERKRLIKAMDGLSEIEEELKEALESGASIDASTVREKLSDVAGYTSDMTESLVKIESILKKYAEAGEDHKEVDETADALGDQLTKTPDVDPLIADALQRIANTDLTVHGVSDTAKTAGNDLYSTIDQIVALSDSLNVSLKDATSGTMGNLKSINDQMANIEDLMQEALEEQLNRSLDPADYTSDISEEKLTEAVRGRATGCVNAGQVEADGDVGGIAGLMGVDMEFDPEREVSTLSNRTTNAQMLETDIIDGCTNDGTVICRGNYTGGIVGRMQLGLVYRCQSLGWIDAGGEYAGGIAGFSGATIRSCLVKTGVRASGYAGGVAGEGSVLADNRAMVFFRDVKQHVGAIAGFDQNVSSDTLSGNLYCGGDIHAIGDVDYEGLAEAADYDTILQDDRGVFHSLRLTFLSEDEVVEVRSLRHGESLAEADVPAVPQKDGFVGTWTRTDFADITTEDRIEAEYTRVVTLIAGDLTREDGKKAILADGLFAPGDGITITDHRQEDGEEILVIRLPEDWTETGSRIHRFRYLPDPAMRDPVIHVMTERGPVKPKTETVGQYLVFEASGREISLVIRDDPSFLHRLEAYAVWIGLGAVLILAVVVLLILIINRRFPKPKKHKKHADAVRATDEAGETGKSIEDGETDENAGSGDVRERSAADPEGIEEKDRDPGSSGEG